MHKLSLVSVALFSIAVSTSAIAKPKYGPEASVLSRSHQYIRQRSAPDFWALMPYYTAQQTESACSLAAVTMVVNGARVHQDLTSDDELATQNNVLRRANIEAWTQANAQGGRGISLDALGANVEATLRAFGFPNVKVEIVHADDQSAATKRKLHEALVANERSDRDFIIANFNQQAFTGDADVGHYAPVGAYDAARKKVLVMDPDRTWYEPYWVSEETFLKGMNTRDSNGEKNRGYLWVKLGA